MYVCWGICVCILGTCKQSFGGKAKKIKEEKKKTNHLHSPLVSLKGVDYRSPRLANGILECANFFLFVIIIIIFEKKSFCVFFVVLFSSQ